MEVKKIYAFIALAVSLVLIVIAVLVVMLMMTVYLDLQPQRRANMEAISQLRAAVREINTNLDEDRANRQLRIKKISDDEERILHVEETILAIDESNKLFEEKILNIDRKQRKHLQDTSRDCGLLYGRGEDQDGVYTIYPDGYPTQVFCDMTQVQGAVVIQKRTNGSLAYDRSFKEYSEGFGSVAGEHWLGLNHVYSLTITGQWKIRFDLESFNGQTAYAEYSEFKIGPAPGFQLLFNTASFEGTTGDRVGNGLAYHQGSKFSAMDKDEDRSSSGSCSAQHGNAGWWFYGCGYVLTTGNNYGEDRKSIMWLPWKGGTALKSAIIRIVRY